MKIRQIKNDIQQKIDGEKNIENIIYIKHTMIKQPIQKMIILGNKYQSFMLIISQKRLNPGKKHVLLLVQPIYFINKFQKRQKNSIITILTMIKAIILSTIIVCALNCTQNCAICNNDTCNACALGHLLSNNTCLRCRQACTQCSSTSFCTDCIRGYYLYNGTCSPCSYGCSLCNSSTQCSTCFSQFYLQNATCHQCGIFCASCANNTVCQSCIRGYYRSNNTCAACGDNCQWCLDNTGCTSCFGPFYALDGSCFICSASCYTCQGSPNNCTSCSPLFFLSNSSCIPCSQCNDTRYCNINGICPTASASNSTFYLSTGEPSDTKTIVLVIVVPIISIIILFAVIHLMVSRCTREIKAQQISSLKHPVQTTASITSSIKQENMHEVYNNPQIKIEQRIIRA